MLILITSKFLKCMYIALSTYAPPPLKKVETKQNNKPPKFHP